MEPYVIHWLDGIEHDVLLRYEKYTSAHHINGGTEYIPKRDYIYFLDNKRKKKSLGIRIEKPLLAPPIKYGEPKEIQFKYPNPGKILESIKKAWIHPEKLLLKSRSEKLHTPLGAKPLNISLKDLSIPASQVFEPFIGSSKDENPHVPRFNNFRKPIYGKRKSIILLYTDLKANNQSKGMADIFKEADFEKYLHK